MERSFLEPDKFVRDEKTGMSKIDRENSEEYRLLEALGTPKVFYALKANKYFKDAETNTEFSDDEIIALGLPIPAEIESARRKLIKMANDAGTTANMAQIRGATAPKAINPPENIRSRLANADPVERMINRVNRSTLGK